MHDSKREIRPLTGLRGIAALSVALGHYRIGNLEPILSIFYWKNAAVDLFFCLSGFTLCLAYGAGSGGPLPICDYLAARVARIYPLYFATLIVSSFVAYPPALVTENDRQVLAGEFIRQLLMVNSWSILGTGIHWNFPAWSVSVEFFCYLLVFPPLFYAAARLRRIPPPIRMIAATLLMAASALVFLRWYNQTIILFGRNPSVAIPERAYAVNLIRGVLGFTAGCLVHASFAARDTMATWAVRRADWVALAVFLSLAIARIYGLQEQWMVLGFPLLILAVASGRSLAARALSWGPIHYLGQISYSVYMLHMPWFYFGFLRAKLFDIAPTNHLSSATILVGGLIVLSALSYHLFEMPLRRVVRRALATPAPAARMPGARSGAGSQRHSLAGWSIGLVALLAFGFEAHRINSSTRSRRRWSRSARRSFARPSSSMPPVRAGAIGRIGAYGRSAASRVLQFARRSASRRGWR